MQNMRIKSLMDNIIVAFECKNNITPSMRKINEGYTEQFPNHFSTDIMDGKLDRWADQGVFLLNTALTVRKGHSASHLKHWSPFTQQILLALNSRCDENIPPAVYILWGKMAKQYRILLTEDCPVIEAEHPVAASYGNRKWHHNNCFIKANNALKELGVETIKW